jgi:hypothetical protein
MKPVHLSTFSLIVILAACGTAAPAMPPAPTERTGVGAATAVIATVPPEPSGTQPPALTSTRTTGVGAATAMVITVLPEPIGTPLPVFTPPPAPTPTPIPALPSGLSPTELKYRVLAHYPDFFFCDPDYYPIARDDELSLAKQRLPHIQSDAELFAAILTHNHLSGLTSFTDEQLLTIYRDYKKLNAVLFQKMGDVYQFDIRIGPEGQGYAIAGTIDDAGTIAEQQRTPTITTCPICLAKGTLIDTPRGQVAVEEMRIGMPVWTAAQGGDRVEGVVLKMVRVFVPVDHRVVHLKLADGRELFASPAHPTADGRVLSDLLPGDLLDGSRITQIEQTVYTGAATYDILPSGPTGFYWANGILVGSTLAGNVAE